MLSLWQKNVLDLDESHSIPEKELPVPTEELLQTPPNPLQELDNNLSEHELSEDVKQHSELFAPGRSENDSAVAREIATNTKREGDPLKRPWEQDSCLSR